MTSISDISLIRASFALQPIVLGAWFPRLPQVQERLDLTTSELALALIGLPIGLLVFLFIGGRLAERLGTRRSMVGGHAAFLLVMPLPAFAPTGATLFVALICAGLTLAAAELALNVTADKIEKTSGRMIMAGCHGFWSVGVLFGSVLGTSFAALGTTTGISLALVSAVLALPLLSACLIMKDYSLATPSREKSDEGPRVSTALLIVCFFAFGIALGEGAMADWAAIYLTDVFEATAGPAGFGYTVFALMVATGRFFGDTIRHSIGLKATAQVFCIGAIVGAILLVFAPTLPIAFVGIALFGLGVSVGFPLAVTAASAAPGRFSDRKCRGSQPNLTMRISCRPARNRISGRIIWNAHRLRRTRPCPFNFTRPVAKTWQGEIVLHAP